MNDKLSPAIGGRVERSFDDLDAVEIGAALAPENFITVVSPKKTRNDG